MNDLSLFGHNRPPPFDADALAEHERRAREFADAAGDYLDLGEIASEEDAQRLNDYMAGARKLRKEIDAARVAEKKPHDEAAKAVQAAFAPVLAILDKSVDKVKPLLTDYLRRKKEAADAEKRRKEHEAARAREEAARLAAQAAARNDVAGEAEAEAAAKEAARLEKEAARSAKAVVASATGGTRSAGLRTARTAEITNINQVFMHYRSHPEVAALLTRLATADVRAKDVDETAIPGIRIIETQVAA